MKKIISFLLTAAMVFCVSIPSAFADTTFSDIQGDDSENAVMALVKAGVINGFDDGTFRSWENITRAQACVMISKAFPGPAASDPGQSAFSDVSPDAWYADAVNYCSLNGIVMGNGAGIFRPQDYVSYYELITMLVRCAGLADDASMTYPDDYVAAAQGIEMLKDVSVDLSLSGYVPATRGNAAFMFCMTMGIDYSSEDDETEPSQPSDSDDGDDNNDSTGTSDVFAGKSGNAYGIVLSTGRTINDDGEDVGMIEFYMQGNTYTLLERGSKDGITSGYGKENGLVRVTLRNGEINEIHSMSEYLSQADSADPSYPYTITQPDSGDLCFYQIKKAGDTYAYYDKDGDPETDDDYIGINDPCVVYVCESDGDEIEYTTGSNSDITEGAYIAAFAIDKDSEGVADVVIVIDESDAGELLEQVGSSTAYQFK